MRTRTVLILAVLALVAVFSLLNWQSIAAPTSLDFLVARVESLRAVVVDGLAELHKKLDAVLIKSGGGSGLA